MLKKIKFKRILQAGLSNIVSGMLFGAGCIIIEHADNTWWHVDNAPSSPTQVASDKEIEPKSNQLGLKTIEPDDTERHIAHNTVKKIK